MNIKMIDVFQQATRVDGNDHHHAFLLKQDFPEERSLQLQSSGSDTEDVSSSSLKHLISIVLIWILMATMLLCRLYYVVRSKLKARRISEDDETVRCDQESLELEGGGGVTAAERVARKSYLDPEAASNTTTLSRTSSISESLQNEEREEYVAESTMEELGSSAKRKGFNPSRVMTVRGTTAPK